MNLRRVWIAPLVGSALLLAGCQASPQATAPTEASGDPTTMTYLAVAPEPEDEVIAGAHFEGKLALTDRGCFGYEANGSSHPAIFPFGTVALEGGSGISVPGADDIKLGDFFTAGGGVVSPAADATWIPQECYQNEMSYLSPN